MGRLQSPSADRGRQRHRFIRNGHDWADRFPTVAQAMASLPVTSVTLDGEAVVVDSKGISDFHSLRRQLGKPNSSVVYKVFDLLWLEGEDLRPLPWGVLRRADLRGGLQGVRLGLPVEP